jgi:hypothetical protein
MAISTEASGTQSCTVTTEHTLATITTAGVYVFEANLTNAVNGDAFRVREYIKTLTGDTAECVSDVVYANDQGNMPQVRFPPRESMFSYAVTITQTAGTSRNVPWAIVKIAS